MSLGRALVHSALAAAGPRQTAGLSGGLAQGLAPSHLFPDCGQKAATRRPRRGACGLRLEAPNTGLLCCRSRQPLLLAPSGGACMERCTSSAGGIPGPGGGRPGPNKPLLATEQAFGALALARSISQSAWACGSGYMWLMHAPRSARWRAAAACACACAAQALPTAVIISPLPASSVSGSRILMYQAGSRPLPAHARSTAYTTASRSAWEEDEGRTGFSRFARRCGIGTDAH